MCLDYLSNYKLDLDENGVGHGFKTFYESKNGNLYSEMYASRWIRRRGCWIKSKGNIIAETWKSYAAWLPAKYKLGFHVFLTERGAKEWISNFTPTPVRFRGVLAKGVQNRRRVVVVEEIWIEEEV